LLGTKCCCEECMGIQWFYIIFDKRNSLTDIL
jgi:hypothetical protein